MARGASAACVRGVDVAGGSGAESFVVELEDLNCSDERAGCGLPFVPFDAERLHLLFEGRDLIVQLLFSRA